MIQITMLQWQRVKGRWDKWSEKS